MTARRTASVFAGFRFPPAVISLAVRWYLRYGLSYRDVEELLAERGIAVDHVTIYRWVQRFTLEFIEAARPCGHAPGDRWFADETYVKVAGAWTCLYRAVDQHGQVIDVLLSGRRDLAAARRFFTRALRVGAIPAEVTTDRAPAYPRVLDELIPSALHTVEQYANNPVEADQGRLKARLRPMRGLKSHRSARILAAGHAFVQNLRRGHDDSLPKSPATTGSARHSTTSRSPSEPTRASGSCSDAVQGRRNATQHCPRTSSVYTSPVVRKRGSSVRRTRVPRMLTGASAPLVRLTRRAAARARASDLAHHFCSGSKGVGRAWPEEDGPFPG